MGNRTRFLAVLLALLCLTGCAIQTGWIIKDGKTLYADEQGYPVTGWQEIEGKTYFFSEDGSMVTGWLEVGGKTYFLLEDGTPNTGWLIDGEKQFFFSSDGTMAQGWTEVVGTQLYFGQEGMLAQGWTEIDGKRYYFAADGTAVTGFLELEDDRYLLHEDGTAHTGWYTEGGKNYYFGTDGAMAVGQVEIEGETCYFNPHGVQMLLVNPWNYLPEGYTVELETVEGYEIATECADAMKQMLDDCRAAGFNPAICSTYRTQEDQEFLYNRKVNNVMALGYNEEDARYLAAKEVAVPGTSEHQLGLAVDIVDDDYWVLDEKQAEMPTQKWLMEHCWDYGFILRYPVGSTDITGIVYEPWHYRYVGTEIAAELRELNITLEEYLGAANHS